MTQPHRIRRQRWQVDAPDPATAFALRSALREEQARSLLPALEAAFEAAGVGDAVVRIPRLELHLTLADPARLAEDLPGQLEAAARRALSGLLAGSGEGASRPGVVGPAERLRHYLRHGRLPWFEAADEPAALHRLLAGAAQAWRALPDAGWSEWRACLPEDETGAFAATLRYLQLLDPPARAALLASAGRRAGVAGRPGVWPVLPVTGAAAGVPPSLAFLAGCLLRAAGRPWPEAAGPIPAALREAGPGGEPVRRARALGQGAVAGLGWSLEKMPAIGGASLAESGEGGDDENASIDHQDDTATAPAWPVHAAGLVLLHPFLPQLFAELQLCDGDGRLPASALPRAAALLYGLASGEAPPGEFVLGLIKPLLGLHPDDPLPVDENDLAPGDLAEGETLLAAVIEHWTALRNTSVDALRLSFLQRRGLLRPAPDGWALHPDGESFDLLLGQLPWGISIVRLPWMSAPVFVEWPTP
nr:hypothetical protein [Dechloromonas sp.]